jgi:hypothetical protein
MPSGLKRRLQRNELSLGSNDILGRGRSDEMNAVLQR